MILNNKTACRICLSTNVKFYHLEAFQLKSYYEEITNEVLTEDDELLHFFCYQCSAMLQKYHSFRELCIKSQESLKRITTQNFNITFEATLKLERCNNKIHSLIKKLDSTAKLGYFEYEENDITEDQSFDDSFSNEENDITEDQSFDDSLSNEENDITEDQSFDDSFSNDSTMQYAENLMQYFANFDSNDDANVNNFQQSRNQVSNNVHEKRKHITVKKSNKNKESKKKHNAAILDATKWKTVILSHEEASKLYHANLQKRNARRLNKYICDYCHCSFTGKLRLINHMPCHSEANGKYECFLCKKRYVTKNKLTKHLPLHLEKYQCLQCPQVFSAKNHIALHEKYHEGVQYTCPHCDAKFLKKSTYYSHLRIIHRSSHVCQFCGASFLNESGLSIHRKRAHKSNDTVDKGIYCKQCDITFENSEAFKVHERNSAKHVIEESDVPGRHKILLKAKWLKETKSRKEVCTQCAEQFSSTILYNRHMQRVHNAPKPVYRSNRPTVCEICGSTVLLNLLPIHMHIHNGTRFPCPDCDKNYSSPANMLRHRRHHKDPKPHTCDLCGKKFSDKCGVKLHVRTVHLKQPHPPRNRTKMKFGSLGKRNEH